MAGIITQRALPRRAFLRGAGAAIALPWLDAMAPALSAAPVGGPARIGFFYVPNGMAMSAWRVTGQGPCPALSPTLAPFESLRDRLTIVSGLAQPAAQRTEGIDAHARAAAAWLSGMPLLMTEAGLVRGAVTADQLAARTLGTETPVASLALSAEASDSREFRRPTPDVATRTISWRGPDEPEPMASDPRVVFELLFGSGSGVDGAGPGGDRSLLDGLIGQVRHLEKRLGAPDRASLDDYLTAIRGAEKALSPADRRRETARSDGAGVELTPAGDPDALTAQLFDLLYLAYRADLTRVATFMFGFEGSERIYDEAPDRMGHHEVSHHAGDASRLNRLAGINRHHVSLFARFCERLRATPDGEGTLLDRAVFLYGAGLGDSDLHAAWDLPLVVVGGGNGTLEGNRHVRYPRSDEEPMANLLLTLLAKGDAPVGRLGDSTGLLPGI